MKNATLLLIGFVSLSPLLPAQTVSDVDGNSYKTVTIGTQTWMAENLKVSRFLDGTAIPLVTDSVAWTNLSAPAYCNYANNVNANGHLYNYYTVIDSRGLCPKGWSVPSVDDWTQLINFLGGNMLAGGQMKETGTSQWTAPNLGANNSSGFSALPGGSRQVNGQFAYTGQSAYFWSTNLYDPSFAYNVILDSYWKNDLDSYYYMYSGNSIRCINKSISTQVNEIEQSNTFKMYPNPANDKITLEFTGYPEVNFKLSVYNLMGQLVIQQQLTDPTSEIDIHQLATGMYVIKMEGKNFSSLRKLIKE